MDKSIVLSFKHSNMVTDYQLEKLQERLEEVINYYFETDEINTDIRNFI